MSMDQAAGIPQRLISELLADDPDLMDLVTEFVNGLPSRIEELHQAHNKADWDLLRTLAHRLKGAGGSYGYPELSRVGAQMEAAFAAHQAQAFSQWMDELQQICNAAVAGLG